MACSCATLSVAPCYIIRSRPQAAGYGNPDAETAFSLQEEAKEDPQATPRARLANRPADHGAARPVGAALELANIVGIARSIADLAGATHRLRRSLADRAAGPPVGAAGSG